MIKTRKQFRLHTMSENKTYQHPSYSYGSTNKCDFYDSDNDDSHHQDFDEKFKQSMAKSNGDPVSNFIQSAVDLIEEGLNGLSSQPDARGTDHSNRDGLCRLQKLFTQLVYSSDTCDQRYSTDIITCSADHRFGSSTQDSLLKDASSSQESSSASWKLFDLKSRTFCIVTDQAQHQKCLMSEENSAIAFNKGGSWRLEGVYYIDTGKGVVTTNPLTITLLVTSGIKVKPVKIDLDIQNITYEQLVQDCATKDKILVLHQNNAYSFDSWKEATTVIDPTDPELVVGEVSLQQAEKIINHYTQNLEVDDSEGWVKVDASGNRQRSSVVTTRVHLHIADTTMDGQWVYGHMSENVTSPEDITVYLDDLIKVLSTVKRNQVVTTNNKILVKVANFLDCPGTAKNRKQIVHIQKLIESNNIVVRYADK